jgi:hypothetical protein
MLAAPVDWASWAVGPEDSMSAFIIWSVSQQHDLSALDRSSAETQRCRANPHRRQSASGDGALFWLGGRLGPPARAAISWRRLRRTHCPCLLNGRAPSLSHIQERPRSADEREPIVHDSGGEGFVPSNASWQAAMSRPGWSRWRCWRTSREPDAARSGSDGTTTGPG